MTELWFQHAASSSTTGLTHYYITLRLSWCTLSFPRFLTMAVTMWPCCNAWLTRYCPVCPVAPSTVIFILTQSSAEADEQTTCWMLRPLKLTAQEFPPFRKFKCKIWLLRCNKEALSKTFRSVIWQIVCLKCRLIKHWITVCTLVTDPVSTHEKSLNHVQWRQSMGAVMPPKITTQVAAHDYFHYQILYWLLLLLMEKLLSLLSAKI